MSERRQLVALRSVAYVARQLILLTRTTSMNDFGWEAWELLAVLKQRLAELREAEKEAEA